MSKPERPGRPGNLSRPFDAPASALECGPGGEYHEEAFLYLLSVERARADRSNHSLRLVLATLEPVPGRPASIPRTTASRLLKQLKRSLRETDVTGWYRQHRVAAAVLSERAATNMSDVSEVIQKRVDEGLRRRLPSRVARSLRVSVVPLKLAEAGHGQENASGDVAH